MDDAQKLQLIRMKVEELQEDLAGRKSHRRARRAMAASVAPQSGSPEEEGMGDLSVGVGQSSMASVLGVVSLASSGVSAYHGYRRNDSLGWGVAWGVIGAVFPIITPAIALAQGFGKPIGGTRSNPGDCPECGMGLGDGFGCDACDAYVEETDVITGPFPPPPVTATPNPSEFLGFCCNATDSQLEAILEKEWKASRGNEERQADYDDAEREAERRGWSVSQGRRR